MNAASTHPLKRNRLLVAGALALALGAIDGQCGGNLPAEVSLASRLSDLESVQQADLERAFWMCDYLATVSGIYATPISTCSAVMAELMTVKFGGDFERLLVWWQKNKKSEYQRLEAASAK